MALEITPLAVGATLASMAIGTYVANQVLDYLLNYLYIRNLKVHVMSVEKALKDAGYSSLQEFKTSLLSRLTPDEAYHFFAYLAQEPSNFDFYMSAYQKLTPPERTIVQALVTNAANKLTYVFDEAVQKAVELYQEQHPEGTTVVIKNPGDIAAETVAIRKAVQEQHEKEIKKVTKTCDIWDIPCHIEKAGHRLWRAAKVLMFAGVGVVGGYYLGKDLYATHSRVTASRRNRGGTGQVSPSE